MTNKQINELDNKSTRHSVEEQIAFVQELTSRSTKRQEVLKQQLAALRIELGMQDENR